MGQDLVAEFSAARNTFAEADEALGFALSDLCWNGPEEELRLTMNAQPAILVHSIAVWRILGERASLPFSVGAGHSLGEFTAYVAAGSISFSEAVRLVRLRGEAMHRAGAERDGAMAAILGLEDEAVEAVCLRASAETNQIVVPANYNSPGQVVISGDADALRRAGELAKEAGSKRAIPLNVSGAFHSPLMSSAAVELRVALEGLAIAEPTFPVVSNVAAEPVHQAAEVRGLLLRQLTGPVRWAQSTRAMIEGGTSAFLEIGPGSVLTGLLRRIDRSASGRALGTLSEVSDFLAEATWN